MPNQTPNGEASNPLRERTQIHHKKLAKKRLRKSRKRENRRNNRRP
jgi:hypothetical protein